MKLRSPAASRAVSFIAVALAFGLIAFPLLGQAKASATNDFRKFEKSTLITPADFIQHAASEEVDIHDLYFELREFEGTKTCLMCHEEDGVQMLDSAHFKWQGKVENIVGLEGGEHGKNDLLNNFCIAVPSNEARCTQCHAGYGYKDAAYDFTNPENIDCLACHDQSGTYMKDIKTAGLPVPSVDLQAVARSIRVGAKVTRKACIGCHAKAGGGDNVKHGDISTDLVATTREYDVHMGTDGGNMTCVTCHGENHDPKTGDVNHGIAGMPLHSVNEGEMKQCTDCHGSQQVVHADTDTEMLIAEGWHERLACQVCHIPAIARKLATKTEWYWADAGDMSRVPVIDPITGKPDYDKKKGTFVWGLNVRPELRYANGMWNRKVIGVMDKYDSVPIDLGSPVGDYSDPKAMIFPFKMMKGNQIVDPVTKTILVPHLFGTAGGPNPYWGKWDWNNAVIDAAAITGQDYSGTYEFAETTMLLSVNHEIAPAENALGFGIMPEACMDCHQTPGLVDWVALGWTGDPLDGGTRNTTVVPVENNSSLLSVKDTPALR
jgi:octaheme c-type cytochrome (tetrathionate reductase family)